MQAVAAFAVVQGAGLLHVVPAGRSIWQIDRRAKVFVCDVCVGVCDKILEAMPGAFADWEAMANEQSLGTTAEAVREDSP